MRPPPHPPAPHWTFAHAVCSRRLRNQRRLRHRTLAPLQHAMTHPTEVLTFWFAGDPSTHRKVWFENDATFDAACADLAAARDMAKSGALDGWAETPRGGLALLILLDQLSRNLHRGTAEAFAADAKGRAVARAMLARGFDQALTPVERMFVYLPFEHSEDLADQDLSVLLFAALDAA